MSNSIHRPHENNLLKVSVLLGDIVILNLLYWLFCSFIPLEYFVQIMRHTMVAGSIIYFACTMNNGVILHHRKVNNHQIVMRVMRNVFVYSLCCFLLFSLGKFPHLSLLRMGTYWIASFVCISIYRIIVRKMLVAWRRKPANKRNVVFVGSNNNARVMYEEMTENNALGYNVLGYFDHQPNEMFKDKCLYLGTPQDLPKVLKKQNDIHELYCCLSSRFSDEILEVIRYCEHNMIHFYSMPNVSNYLHHRMHLNLMGDVPYLSLYNEPLSQMENRLVKRLFDILVSLTFLCTLFPIILVIVTAITKITMPGPIFFRQKRTGLNGNEFYCLKFRSMKVNKDADTLQATKNDPRKTKWGNIMRMTNIDELPQFINVLLGQMSIVGPRPHMVKHTDDYSKLIDNYMVRHYIKPGITGWSQVTGFRGETKQLSQMEGRVEGDIWYLEHWSIWLDIYIMYKTVANVIVGDKQAF